MKYLNAFFDWLNDVLVVRPAQRRAEEQADAEEKLFQRNMDNLWQTPKGDDDGN